jgi:tetratricopeptide (TPR) repeat protein
LVDDEANFRAALAYWREHDPYVMLELIGSFWRFWSGRGQLDEAQRWLEDALAADVGGSSLARANALRGLGAVAGEPYAQDVELARTSLEEAIAIYREHHNDAGLAASLNNLGLLLGLNAPVADLDRATELLEEALKLQQRLSGGQAIPAAIPLSNLADIALRRGDLTEVRRLSNQQLAVARADDDDLNVADARARLAWAAALEGNFDEARRLLPQLLRILSELGALHPFPVLALAAIIAAHSGRRSDAAKVFGAIAAHRARTGAEWWQESVVTRAIVDTEQELLESGYGQSHEEGRELSPEEMFELALRAIA